MLHLGVLYRQREQLCNILVERQRTVYHLGGMAEEQLCTILVERQRTVYHLGGKAPQLGLEEVLH